MKSKKVANGSEEKLEVAKISRLEEFLEKKDEMNSIRLMLSLPNGCNHLVKGETPIFEYAWNNDMLTLCNAICDCYSFNPNVNSNVKKAFCPISHSVFIDAYCDDSYPKWKTKLYQDVADKILSLHNIDLAVRNNEGINLLMYMAERSNYVEKFIDIFRKAYDIDLCNGDSPNYFVTDEDGYSVVTYALSKGNLAFVAGLYNIVGKLPLSKEDKIVVENCRKIINHKYLG